MKDLLALPTDKLLDKFGAGKHAPGSGSAAALMGLLSAQLITTVGQLTLKKSDYQHIHSQVAQICSAIEVEIVPALEHLFQVDAEVFDKVIRARLARNAATNSEEKAKYQKISLEIQKEATAIPFQIAKYCLALIDHANVVLGNGFQGARGDAGAAFSSAMAGVLSSIFIINLNLKSFKASYWARQQRKECDRLQNLVETKYKTAIGGVMMLRAEDDAVSKPATETDLIHALSVMTKPRYSPSDIEERVSIVHKHVWRKNKESVGAANASAVDPVSLLSPEIALNHLGYSHEIASSLGSFQSQTGSYEVAGLLNNPLGQVSISAQMNASVRRFTAAHELGHVVLHPYMEEAHRDRPLDGSAQSKERSEYEADNFAAMYLMPSNLVRARFIKIFLTRQFSLNQDTCYALGENFEQAMQQIQSKRELSRLLARTERYNGQQVISIANQFGVSIEAMAIRIEELDLLE